MRKNITYAKIWLPHDKNTIKVQQMCIENMDSIIGSISVKLGAKVQRTSFMPPMPNGRFTLIRPANRSKTYSQRETSFYGRPQFDNPEVYLRYDNEHPIIGILRSCYYNDRISYYKLWEFLNKNSDFNWSVLEPYYKAVSLDGFKLEPMDSVKKSISGNITETAHGYSPIGGSAIIREYRQEAASFGEWEPSDRDIQQEVNANSLVLKRVFKKKI